MAQEITQLKERLATEAGKREKAGQLAHDLQESILKVNENFDNVKRIHRA